MAGRARRLVGGGEGKLLSRSICGQILSSRAGEVLPAAAAAAAAAPFLYTVSGPSRAECLAIASCREGGRGREI